MKKLVSLSILIIILSELLLVFDFNRANTPHFYTEPISAVISKNEEGSICIEDLADSTLIQNDSTSYTALDNTEKQNTIVFDNNSRYEIDFCDTLYKTKDATFILYHDKYSKTNILADGRTILIECPSLCLYPYNENVSSIYYMETTFKQCLIDFADPNLRGVIQQFLISKSDFSRYSKDYFQSISYEGQTSLYGFTVDVPQETIVNHDNIMMWLTELIRKDEENMRNSVGIELYDSLSVNKKKSRMRGKNLPAILGSINAEKFFYIKQNEYPNPYDAPAYLISVRDMRLVLYTDRFITYQYYEFDYNGGIHGQFNSILQSYDHIHKERIDCAYLIKQEYIDSVKMMLIDVAFQSELFRIKSSVRTKEEAYFKFLHQAYSLNAIKSMTLPCPGLSEEGLVFSYAPYDIDCFASGCYHFVIPYRKIWPYLTKRGKWCIEKKDGI